jgi:cell division transport system permease protein
MIDKTLFQYPKPINLLKFISKLHPNKNSTFGICPDRFRPYLFNIINPSYKYFDNKKAIDTLTSVIDGSEKLGFIMYVVFALFAVIITLNTIRLAIFISKDEIHVMNLVGAEASYIKGPFVVTGAIYGVVATVIVLLALWPLSVWLTTVAQRFFVDINFLDYYMNDFFTIAGILLVSGVAISSISSYLAVRKYLRNNKVKIK